MERWQSDPPVAAAVVSHFNDCPDSHSQFCFHGTCRFLVQEDKPACVCHSGYVGARCEHADLLAVVAASQKKQAITALVVVSIVALAVLIIACVLIHGLKSPEGVWPGRLWQPEEERTSSGRADRPSCSASNHLCSLFCLLWAFLQQLCQELCLLGVIWCDLEKKSVDHGLKTGQKRIAKGWASC
uniref:Protransforming growth factor alpha isoform X1 n=1 Tax=Callorhinus ursinus TaxID=34884 RepID=A0A3Q7NRG7_CALUR|nr:protransforming growth factor alpha isoform X1 [Callorhinus ursinus]